MSSFRKPRQRGQRAKAAKQAATKQEKAKQSKFKMPDIRAEWRAFKRRLARESQADRIKFFILIIIIAIGIAIGVACIPFFTQLLDENTRAAFVADIQSKGILGILVLLALQILQVVIAIIPGEVVQIMAGVLYGAVDGWAVCTIGTALSSAIVYWLVGRLGAPFVEKMISPKQAKRIDMLNETNRNDFIMFVIFFIPGLPKDVFTYFAPITKMSLKRFLVISLIARSPALIASTYGGSAWTQGNYFSMALVFLIVGGLGVLGIIFNDKILDRLGPKKKAGTTGKKASAKKSGAKAWEAAVDSASDTDTVNPASATDTANTVSATTAASTASATGSADVPVAEPEQTAIALSETTPADSGTEATAVTEAGEAASDERLSQ